MSSETQTHAEQVFVLNEIVSGLQRELNQARSKIYGSEAKTKLKIGKLGEQLRSKDARIQELEKALDERAGKVASDDCFDPAYSREKRTPSLIIQEATEGRQSSSSPAGNAENAAEGTQKSSSATPILAYSQTQAIHSIRYDTGSPTLVPALSSLPIYLTLWGPRTWVEVATKTPVPEGISRSEQYLTEMGKRRREAGLKANSVKSNIPDNKGSEDATIRKVVEPVCLPPRPKPTTVGFRPAKTQA